MNTREALNTALDGVALPQKNAKLMARVKEEVTALEEKAAVLEGENKWLRAKLQEVDPRVEQTNRKLAECQQELSQYKKIPQGPISALSPAMRRKLRK
jgi:phage shock protein A